MEDSYDSAAKWSDSNNSPYSMVSWSLQSGNFPADEFVGGLEKAESLSRSHRLAEKRRRDRINYHLSALRKLVPDSDKLDKAALLATVIEQVKELKQKATESPIFQDLPTEADEVTVQSETISNGFESNTNRVIFKASFCCEDQPEAISEIIRVLTKFQLETIQAEIICLGGRMRFNFILNDSNCKETTTMAASAKALKQSLCAALHRITSSSSSSSSNSSVCRIRSKRQRWFLSSHYSR